MQNFEYEHLEPPHPFWSQEARKNIKKRVSSTNSTHPMLRLSLQLLLVTKITQFEIVWTF